MIACMEIRLRRLLRNLRLTPLAGGTIPDY